MGLKVYQQCCQNCLFSKDKIVNNERKRGIIKDCIQNQSHFTCHKATMKNEDIVCHGFFSHMGDVSQLVRIAKRLGVVEMIPMENNGKLPTQKEIEATVRRKAL